MRLQKPAKEFVASSGYYFAARDMSLRVAAQLRITLSDRCSPPFAIFEMRNLPSGRSTSQSAGRTFVTSSAFPMLPVAGSALTRRIPPGE